MANVGVRDVGEFGPEAAGETTVTFSDTDIQLSARWVSFSPREAKEATDSRRTCSEGGSTSHSAGVGSFMGCEGFTEVPQPFNIPRFFRPVDDLSGALEAFGGLDFGELKIGLAWLERGMTGDGAGETDVVFGDRIEG